MDVKPCLVSPVLFLINTVVAYMYGYVFYALLWFQLMLTSFYYHGVGDVASAALDKAMIGLIVCYGGYLFVTKLGGISGMRRNLLAAIVFCAFIATIYLYVYGKYYGDYCFHEDVDTADWWHAGLHAVSTAGHLCIILI